MHPSLVIEIVCGGESPENDGAYQRRHRDHSIRVVASGAHEGTIEDRLQRRDESLDNQLSAGSVEENGQRGRRSEYLPADMGIIGIRVETEVVEAIEQQVHRDPHFHASQVHSQADVCAVAP